MDVIITGGAGFIGFNLSERLLSMGHDVKAIDNLGIGKLRNLSECVKNLNFKLFKNDLISPISLIVRARNLRASARQMNCSRLF